MGIVAVVFGLSKYHAAAIGDYDFTDSFRFAWAVSYAIGLGVIAYGLGLPDLPRSARSAFSTSVAAVLLGCLSVSVVQLVVGDALLPRFVVFGSAALLLPWFLAMSALGAAGRVAAETRDRVLLVSDEPTAELVALELADRPEKPATVIGNLTAEEAARVAERRRPLVEAATAAAATVVVLDHHGTADERVVDQAAVLHEAGVRVRTLSLFYEEWMGKLPVADLERVSLFFDIGELHRARFARLKRVVDVVTGVVGCVVLVAVVPFVLAGNLVANRGSLFYTQPRVGRRGRVFTIVKFRTMVPGRGGAWTVENDPRITRFGHVLRRSHLDELPQMWNILRGDLSLVGPRPEQPAYVTELVAKVPFYDLRHLVRPGLTGWAQVKTGYGSTDLDAIEKLQYEFHYLRRQDLMFDLRIVGRTIRSVLQRGGR